MENNKILLVEDEPIIRRVHTLFLKNMKISFDVVVNGEQALEKIKHEFYSLVILDAGLPDIQGLSLAKKIRNFEKDKKNLRSAILLLSAYSTQLLAKWCEEAEIDCFAVKPMQYQVFSDQVTQLI